MSNQAGYALFLLNIGLLGNIFPNKAFLTKKSFEIHLMTIQIPLLTEEKIEIREKITVPKFLWRIQLFPLYWKRIEIDM